MRPLGGGKRIALKAGLLAAGILLALGPAPAGAQGCTLTLPTGSWPVNGTVAGVLVETIEHTAIVPNEEAVLERHARAKEMGELGHGCGSLASFAGRIQVHAESWVPVLDHTVPLLGTGPISGVFHIYPVDGAKPMKGALSGSLNFYPTHPNELCGGPCPWVYASGDWSIAKTGAKGQFAGLALVPYPCELGLCYWDPTGTLGTGPVALTPEELIPAPSAKFVITLFQ
jgi:hypothetical protein